MCAVSYSVRDPFAGSYSKLIIHTPSTASLGGCLERPRRAPRSQCVGSDASEDEESERAAGASHSGQCSDMPSQAFNIPVSTANVSPIYSFALPQTFIEVQRHAALFLP